jgi:hypothetical protein
MNSSTPLTTFIEGLIAQGKISTFRKPEILRAFQTAGYKSIGDLTSLSNEEWSKMRLPPVTVKNLQDSLASLGEGSPIRANNSRAIPPRTSETPDRKTINASISRSPGNIFPTEITSNSVQSPITSVSTNNTPSPLPQRQNSTNNNTKAQAVTKNEFSSKLAGIIGTGPPPVSTTPVNVPNDRERQDYGAVLTDSAENTVLFPTKSRPKNPGRRIPTNPGKRPKPLPEPKKYRAGGDSMGDSIDQGTYSESYDLTNAKEENTPDTSLDGSEFSESTYKLKDHESNESKNNDRSISHGNQDRKQVTRNTPRAPGSLSPANSTLPLPRSNPSSSTSTPLSSTPPTMPRNAPAAGMNNPTRATSYRNGVSTNTRPTPLLSLGLNNVHHDRSNSGHATDQGLGSTDRGRRDNEPDIDDMTDEEIDSEYGKLIDELLALG